MIIAHCKLRRLLLEFLFCYSLFVYSTPHPITFVRTGDGIPSSFEYWEIGGQQFVHPPSQSSVIWPESVGAYSKPNSLRMNQQTTPGINPLRYSTSTYPPPVPKLKPKIDLFRNVDQPIDLRDGRNALHSYPSSEMVREKPPVNLYASEDLYSQANKELLRYKLQDGPLDSSGKALSVQAIKPPGLKDFAVTNFIEGDGNCQFYAVSMLLQGNTDLHAELRARAVAHMEDHKEDFVHFVALDGQHKSWEEYCTNMKKDKEFGDELTLQALARVYQRNFLVLSDSLNHESVVVVPVQGSESNDMPYLPLYLNQLHYEILLKDNGTPNSEGKNTNFLTNPDVHKSPSSTELETTQTDGPGVAPVEADTLSDSDRVPLIDRTQPTTEHQSPKSEVPSLVDGGRRSGQGNLRRKMYRSRLMNQVLKFWRMSFRSIWKKIMSMFKRHREQS